MKQKMPFVIVSFLATTLIVLSYNACSPGFQTQNMASSGIDGQSLDSLLAEKGRVLYGAHCASCHNEISSSTKKDRNSLAIQAAINGISQMNDLKSKITADDADAIAAALSLTTCSPVTLGKTTIRRMNYQEFYNSTKDLLGDHTLTRSDYPDDTRGASGFLTEGGALLTLGPDTEKIVSAAEKIVDQILANPSSEFNSCGSAQENVCSSISEGQTSNLTCPAGQVVTSIVFSSYGLPNGSCGNFSLGSCNSTTSKSAIEAACLGKTSCQLSASNAVFGDPCAGPTKRLAVEVRCGRQGGAAAPNYQSCVQALLTKTARRAFRMPVTEADIKPLVNFAMTGLSAKEGMRDALVAIIAAPQFLFHYVNYSRRNGNLHTLSPHELASRLSFFLWSSIPDDTLNRLADSGELLKFEVLKAQVDRMLQDPRSLAFIQSFPSQWWGFDELLTVKRSQTLHPEFTTTLKSAMLKESEMLAADIIRRNLPADTFVSANYTFVNQELAAFYGLPTSHSSPSFIAVPLDGVNRRGNLTQGAMMTATLTNDYNNPIHRGVHILKKVMCNEVPPPPPGLPSLDQLDPSLPMKERLARHTSDKSCKSCHQHIDPAGLVFEHFTSTGKWRDRDGNHPVDAAGITSDGFSFKKPGEFAGWIAIGDKFEKCTNEYLVSYAIGRGASAGEKCYSNKIVKERMTATGATLNDLIKGIVTSDLFLKSVVKE